MERKKDTKLTRSIMLDLLKTGKVMSITIPDDITKPLPEGKQLDLRELTERDH